MNETIINTNASNDVSNRDAKQIVPKIAAFNDIACDTKAAGIP